MKKLNPEALPFVPRRLLELSASVPHVVERSLPPAQPVISIEVRGACPDVPERARAPAHAGPLALARAPVRVFAQGSASAEDLAEQRPPVRRSLARVGGDGDG